MRRIILAGLLLLSACAQNKQQTKAVTDTSSVKKTSGIQYTCTMHPDVLSTKPGTCPKCGMDLVEKDNSK